jgi:glycosyltransferase involved in cell wall biosynthesis
MRPAIIVPALDAMPTIGDVVTGLRDTAGPDVPIFVVDDGSRDDTATIAQKAGATVIRHPFNLGKGAAILTGLAAARQRGCVAAVTVDADGQHPPREAAKLLDASIDVNALVLGVRDLEGSGAPRGNIIGNRASNFFVSVFTRRRFRDTQCGLRRYPVEKTLDLDTHDQRFGFEAEIIFAAKRAGVPIVEIPVRVLYPPRAEHRTHYRAWRDTVHIVLRITWTILFPIRWVLAACAAAAAIMLLHRASLFSTHAHARAPTEREISDSSGNMMAPRTAGDLTDAGAGREPALAR